MAESTRTSNNLQGELGSPGPFIGKVVNNLDPMRQGALEVELLKNIGNQNSASQQLFTVKYLSPFYGTTDVDLTGSDPEEFNHTQKSYGFWFVPPDTGTLVMCIFVDGDPGQGYWMGCVQNPFMNHMIPGIAATKSIASKARQSDETKWESKTVDPKTTYSTDFLPVGEINRGSIRDGKSSINPKVDDMKKPIHPFADVLVKQGLITDDVRGTTSSSARRDIPSSVFGISTPGPLDRRTNAQKGNIGRSDAKVNKFISRLGGTQLIMDDGNERKLRKNKPDEGPPEYIDQEGGGSGGLVDYPHDESFRIRTRTGHQILMHNSEDLIYITNAAGSAWIEFTSNGKIDIYCDDSISIRTAEDFNFVADRDINFHADRSINMFAAQKMAFETGGDLSLKAGAAFGVVASTDISLSSSSELHLHSGSGFHASGQDMRFSGNNVDILAGGIMHVSASSDMNLKSNRTLISSGANTEILSGSATILGSSTLDLGAGGNIVIKGAKVDINGPAAMPASQAVAALPADQPRAIVKPLTLYPLPGIGSVLVKRAPTAEPWAHHENTNPPGFTSDLTDRENSSMPYALNDERLTIKETSDAAKVPSEQGGGAGFGGTESSGVGGGAAIARQSKKSAGAPPTDHAAAAPDPNNAVKTDYNDASSSRMPSDWLQDKEFIAKAGTIGSKYGQKLEEFITLMRIESGCSPTIRNAWGYTGLIQFGPDALTTLNRSYKTNWSTDSIRLLSRAQQLDVVEQYFDYWKKARKIQDLSLGRMYILTFMPAYVNHPASHVIAPPSSKVAQRNATLCGPDGYVTVQSVMNQATKNVPLTAQMLKRAGY
jgi:uncharacterized protein (DUF2345 family)